ncbi:MAG: hypothetical protein KBA75_04925 [Alphaproteobacteria bacterium]|nr:hypothetical protein [Alphaproteobacteria bacterium]
MSRLTPRLFINPFILILLAALWGGLFLGTLHPATGFLGGFVFTFIGGIAPVMMNCCLAWGIASFLSTRPVWNITLGIIFAFVLALLPALPALYDQIVASPIATYEVREKVALGQEMTIDLHPKPVTGKEWWKPLPIIFEDPMFLPWAVGGHAGCMCMFFKVRSASTFRSEGTYSTVLELLVARNGHNVQSLNAWVNRSKQGLWFAYAIEQTERGTYNLKFDVMNRETATATFWQKDIPATFVEEEPVQGRKDSLEKRFYGPALRILFSDNIPTWIMDPFFKSTFPYRAFNKFLHEAVEWPQKSAQDQKAPPINKH